MNEKKNRIRGEPKLTDRQKAFVLEYLKDGNAARAARDAGFAEKSARNTGHKMLHDERYAPVQEEIRRLQQEKYKEMDCDAGRVLAVCGAVICADPLDLLREDGSYKTLAEMDERTRMAIEEIDKDGVPHLYKKTEFVKLMMKRHGLLTDRTEITGAGGGALEITWSKE